MKVIIVIQSPHTLSPKIILTNPSYSPSPPVLKHHDHSVHIPTLSPNAPSLGMVLELAEFFKLHDPINGPVTIPNIGVRIINAQDKIMKRLNVASPMASWDMLYFRLRRKFRRPIVEVLEVAYETKKTVVSSEKRGEKVIVTYTKTGDPESFASQSGSIEANILIGADGASLTVKRLVFRNAAGEYARYIILRGLVPEPDKYARYTHRQSRAAYTPYLYPYLDGITLTSPIALSPPQPSAEATTTDGRTHSAKSSEKSGPSSKLRLATTTRTLVSETARPCFVGDEQTLVRPYMGVGASRGAIHALELEKMMQNFCERRQGSWEVVARNIKECVVERVVFRRLGEVVMGSGGALGENTSVASLILGDSGQIFEIQFYLLAEPLAQTLGYFLISFQSPRTLSPNLFKPNMAAQAFKHVRTKVNCLLLPYS
ncbi:uncharacterized protein BDR25DRAFT_353837 [Lindgomyces ingoldianus]|uniref:Uncharacterized protein n=1 Tax=Lindgomyces ingoldianus TaxID=673940 RepID=A0ACB6QYG8_9PLEO|nr:uncharacterized protein BDR25DRAFT_353837 [Lindgomyces ingoldianus]KAF2472099.1 hypothetical protein BDR25DRAFT_353837 [Lindgomyces ingoldianus]